MDPPGGEDECDAPNPLEMDRRSRFLRRSYSLRGLFSSAVRGDRRRCSRNRAAHGYAGLHRRYGVLVRHGVLVHAVVGKRIESAFVMHGVLIGVLCILLFGIMWLAT